MTKLFKIHCSQIAKIMAKKKGDEIPVGAQTFLKEWYSGDHEEIQSKYIDKGNQVEIANIDFMAQVLGFGLAKKNEVVYSDEYFIGTPDVVDLPPCVEIKSPWDRKSLLDNMDGIDPQHEWQSRGYMRLLNRSEAIVFYGLQNTPATEWRDEVIYDDLPDSDRWIAYRVTRDLSIEEAIIERVKLCRVWLEKYDKEVKSKIGRIN